METSRSYREALLYLERFYNFEMTPRPSRFGLANIERLLGAIGSPESAWSALHIAGTKGKGSTAAMAEAILGAHGFTTGLYTSPHLTRIEERCAVGGEPITEEEFVAGLEVLKPVVEAMLSDGYTPSFFDVLTAIAFRNFARRGVNAAVVEVGIGGRLDSTNAVHPAVSLITTLALDHTDWLGETIELISAEKAGIIRSGVPVVSHPQEPAAGQVVETTCREKGAALERVGAEIALEEESPGRARSRFAIATPDARYEGLQVKMLGKHQRVNAAAAVRGAELFAVRTAGRRLEEGIVRNALSRAFLPARIEIVRESPTVIVDGAHNPISMRTLFATLRDAYPRARPSLVFGCAADKDAEAIFRESGDWVRRWYFTRNPTPRAADPEALASVLRLVAGASIDAEVHPEPARALEAALAEAGPEDVVCCTGSFILAGALREILKSG